MSRRMLVGILLCLLVAPAMVKAQPAPDAGGNNNGGDNNNRRNRGNGGGGGGGGGQDFRQQFMDRLKTDMGAKDDEWKVIEPKLQKVVDLGFQNRMRGMGFNRGGNNNGGNRPGGNNADNPVSKATQDLRETLDNKDASADDIAKKLTALRDAREKSKAELTAAQKDLKEILTQRQEAVLVMAGQLD